MTHSEQCLIACSKINDKMAGSISFGTGLIAFAAACQGKWPHPVILAIGAAFVVGDCSRIYLAGKCWAK